MSTSNQALADELEAVNAIYNPHTLVVTDVDAKSTVSTTVLSLPDVEFSFLLSFPSEYPDVPPVVIGTQSTGPSSKKGEGEAALNVLRDVLGQIYQPGQVCLFDLIEETKPLLQPSEKESSSSLRDAAKEDGSTEDCSESCPDRSADSLPPQIQSLNIQDLTMNPKSIAASSFPPPKWVLSEDLVVNKSTFVARALHVSSLSEATESISHLLATHKKVASATHNITAWRIKQKQDTTSPTTQISAPEITIQDSDDDGETAAGGRLLHLMQLMDVWNVVVVVTRWYGGVKLGPDRFRVINAVAREALVNGGFVKEDTSKGKGKGKKK